MASPRPVAARWVALLAGLLGLDLVASGAVLLHRAPSSWRPHPPAASVSADNRALPAVQPDAYVAAQALLEARAAAVRAHDQRRFLAGVDPYAPAAFKQAQARSFSGASTLPLSSWSYRVLGDQLRHLSPSREARYGGATTYSPDVLLRYRLKGYDAEPAVELLRYTFVQRAGRWYLGADDDFAAAGERSGRGPWDFGALRTIRARSALVLYHPGSESLARLVAAEAQRAIPRVSAAWGRVWSQRVVVVVPRSRAELEALLGEDDLDSIAAVATADLPNGVSGEEPVGDRVLVNPEAFRRLGPAGRRVVLTHEVTHVATRRASPDAMPSWLVEGFADYVAFTGSGVPVSVAASELRRDVRSGRRLGGLPTEEDFEADAPRLAQAYEGAWLAVRLLAERLGPRGVADFYAGVGAAMAAGAPAAVAVEDALDGALRLSADEFTAQWAEYVGRQLR